MTSSFDHQLEKYAEVIVKIGLNVQPGQRLRISAPIEASGLVHRVTAAAYKAGSPLVDVTWSDPQLDVIRLENASPDSIETLSEWRYAGFLDSVKRGDAYLVVISGDPDLYDGQDPDLVTAMQRAKARAGQEALKLVDQGYCSWLVVRTPTAAWGAKLFPDLSAEEREASLWKVIFNLCRVDRPDPVGAWKEHIARLNAVVKRLTEKRYATLKLTAPGTDLTVGLADDHVWEGPVAFSSAGIPFVANIPTEEVFTAPHKDRVNGTVKASYPLNHYGSLIEDFSLTFENGRVVNMSAGKGEAVLRNIIETDEGARRLGEIALVPHSSPISSSGILFYDSLFDENAACHIALGSAYPTSIKNGTSMSQETLDAAGANDSMIHVDFMIGSDKMDVDGILENGEAEPVMRGGEWAFDV